MVNVIGLGYIGLPTALMLASHGIKVIGTNHHIEKVERLRAGQTTFREKGMDELFRAAAEGGIVFSTELAVADTYIVSVQTPYDEFTKKVDMSFVNAAVGDVLRIAPKGAVIVIESTVSPGSVDRYVRPFIEDHGLVIGRDIHLVHAPERIIPGNMIYELVHNNRTIGSDDPEIGERIKAMYASFCQGEIVVTDIKTAEMTKVIENTYRCVNIAFANELAKICHHDGMNVDEIIRICNMHPRVNILRPGPGVGGHCIPVDPWFLVGDYPGLTPLIHEALNVNASMPAFVLKRIGEIMEKEGIRDVSRVGLYGLSFKENVDDYRDSPALQLLRSQKLHLGTPLKAYDPYIERDIVENQFHSLEAFLAEVDFVVVMVKHREILERTALLKDKVVLDCHHVLGQLPRLYRL
ncbi:MAG: nucleotide sugar dehydrogenase [Oscillospiraceae bacterium]|nr:nucleotide sugar dehydrogenase [Oscillospiraceae bacterium]